MVLSFLVQGQAPSNPILGFLPILLIFAIFYFLLFLPMQRQRKQQQKLLRELQPGNLVVTSGGVMGTIVSLDDETVILRVKPDNLKIQVTRSSVAGLVPEKK
ncbi:MAG TPA: preprotein translocase subunit YajC [Bryobacteraceae bacterium]|nr:preprotein translocase subunit YajC [Bryobacteraceae bacterium]